MPGFLIWPTFWRSQRSKFKTAPVFARFITIWPLEHSNLVSRHHLPFYQISAQSDFKYGHQVAVLEKEKKLLLLLNWWLDQLNIFIIGISNKYTWHNIQVFDLTYCWRSQRVGTFLPNFDLVRLQILPPDGPLGNILLHLSSYRQHYLN
jgi:hypothetical protein